MSSDDRLLLMEAVMVRVLAGVALIVAFASCSDPVTSADAACIAAVNVDGVTFRPVGGTTGYADPSAVSPEAYLTIVRHTGCLDEGQPAGELAHAESNFLAVGTTLHRIAGSEPHEALAIWLPLIGEWEILRPHGS
jgi:hypothetical protein